MDRKILIYLIFPIHLFLANSLDLRIDAMFFQRNLDKGLLTILANDKLIKYFPINFNFELFKKVFVTEDLKKLPVGIKLVITKNKTLPYIYDIAKKKYGYYIVFSKKFNVIRGENFVIISLSSGLWEVLYFNEKLNIYKLDNTNYRKVSSYSFSL